VLLAHLHLRLYPWNCPLEAIRQASALLCQPTYCGPRTGMNPRGPKPMRRGFSPPVSGKSALLLSLHGVTPRPSALDYAPQPGRGKASCRPTKIARRVPLERYMTGAGWRHAQQKPIPGGQTESGAGCVSPDGATVFGPNQHRLIPTPALEAAHHIPTNNSCVSVLGPYGGSPARCPMQLGSSTAVTVRKSLLIPNRSSTLATRAESRS